VFRAYILSVIVVLPQFLESAQSQPVSTHIFERHVGLIDILGEFVYDVSDLSGRKCLILLKENPSSVFDIYPGEKVVILSENETVRLASVGSDRFVRSTEAESVDIADLFDLVTEFPQIVDRRLLDVFVSKNSIPH